MTLSPPHTHMDVQNYLTTHTFPEDRPVELEKMTSYDKDGSQDHQTLLHATSFWTATPMIK